MALANDNWYAYVQDIVIRNEARWIECACASICWTTLIMYQLEVPSGVGPGQQFQAQVGDSMMVITCPAGAGPGSTIQALFPPSLLRSPDPALSLPL